MRKIFILFLVLVPFFSYSQRWKKNRKELCFSLGAANFLGDLGGANRTGSDFVRDLEFSLTRPSVAFGYRYRIHEYQYVRGSFFFGRILGKDQLTSEVARNNRQLSFRSNIYELSVQYELTMLKQRDGHHYNIKNVKGWRNIFIQPYAFIGAGATYFNPKAFLAGKWYELQPMGTEGQGLVPGTKKYKRITACIPMGIGFRYGISKKMTLGLEYGYRITFTDYMDDVSGKYYDREAIRDARGDVAAYFSDPSSGVNPSWTAPGEIRGDPTDKDGYMFALLSLNYRLGKTYRTRAKF